VSLPKYNEIMAPALEYLSLHGVERGRDLESPLADHFGLTPEQQNKMYDSGNGKIFLDRVSWALSYLIVAKLIERPKRGYYQITVLGREFVGDDQKIQSFVKEKSAERDAELRAGKTGNVSSEAIESDLSETTPQEVLNQAYSNIRTSSYETILDTILSKSPYDFEQLVVSLLDKMGYGGQIKDAGQVTKKSNDGGIDGIVKEDVLGLGRIHIQAKRYARESTIGREDIQKFVGALAVAQSNKGVFITTSRYSEGAKEYANSLNGTTTVILIDGLQLAEYIYTYGLGMQVEQVIEIKKMDADYWNAMQDISQ
jgi:restriction system protein